MSPGSDELLEALADRDRLDARIASLVADVDWTADGATSMTAWLRDHARMTSREAARVVSRPRHRHPHRVRRPVARRRAARRALPVPRLRPPRHLVRRPPRPLGPPRRSHRLDNLVLLCRRHHTLLHKPGWHAKLLPDGTLEVTTPDGEHRTSRPPGVLEPFP